MTSRRDELNEMKTRIDLRAVVASYGYEVDRKNSSRNSTCMRRGSEKVFIAVGRSGQWIYWSVGDGADNGTVIDFVASREGYDTGGRIDLGRVRQHLRPMIGTSASTSGGLPEYAGGFGPKPRPIAKDRQAVLADFGAAETLEDREGYLPYLCDVRRIPASLLASERWSGRIRIDGRGNALFPHYDQDGLCGIEIKNDGFTGFSKAGTKGLFSAVGKKDDDRQLVIAETAIDLASYAALFPNEHSRYVSTAGSLNKTQPALLNRAMANMPQDSRIVAAVDNDTGGDKLIEAIEPIFRHVHDTLGRGDLQWIVHRPEILNDWNDELRATPPSPTADDNAPQP